MALLVNGVLLVTHAAPAEAMMPCVEPDGPGVAWLEATPNGLRAELEGRYLRYVDGVAQQRAVRFVAGAGWSVEPPRACGQGQQPCGEPPGRTWCEAAECRIGPPCTGITLPPITAADLGARPWPYGAPRLDEVEQKLGACVTAADRSVYFGLAFYGSEGQTGIGGVGRSAPNGSVEIRRPTLLVEGSVTAMAANGAELWLAVNGLGECTGVRPGAGLVRYDWSQDKATAMRWPAGPCGQVINDVLWQGSSLWVATDQGLSRHDPKAGTWEHFAPAGDTGAITPAMCAPPEEPAVPGAPTPAAPPSPPPPPTATPTTPRPRADDGCGCSTGTSTATAGLGLLLLGVGRRRSGGPSR